MITAGVCTGPDDDIKDSLNFARNLFSGDARIVCCVDMIGEAGWPGAGPQEISIECSADPISLPPALIVIRQQTITNYL
jgi:hypothetical protein